MEGVHPISGADPASCGADSCYGIMEGGGAADLETVRRLGQGVCHAFICIRVDGALDLPASRELLFSLVSLVKTPGEFHILIDTRRAQASLSEVDLFELGFEVASHRAVAQSKTALLTSLGEEERARFLELVAENRGALLRAFTSFEEAITWLVMNGGEQ